MDAVVSRTLGSISVGLLCMASVLACSNCSISADDIALLLLFLWLLLGETHIRWSSTTNGQSTEVIQLFPLFHVALYEEGPGTAIFHQNKEETTP